MDQITSGSSWRLLSGAVVGLTNGILVAYFRLPPFIMTLATLTAARGVALEITQGQPITRSTPVAVYLGQGYVGPVPVPIFLMVIIVLATHFILSSTPMGSYIYSVGGNEEAARLSGVKVGPDQSLCLCGLRPLFRAHGTDINCTAGLGSTQYRHRVRIGRYCCGSFGGNQPDGG